MDHVVLVIHLIITLVLIALILLQRSEGGGLGLGTGGGLGNFASAQSTANALTKITTFVAIGFFATSLILAIMASRSGGEKSILDQIPNQAASQTVGQKAQGLENTAVPADKGEASDKNAEQNSAPQVPLSGTESGASNDNGANGAANNTVKSDQSKSDAPSAPAPIVPLTK